MKLRPARFAQRSPEPSVSHERPDDLYALFQDSVDEVETDAASQTAPAESLSLPADSAGFSLSDRLAPFEQSPPRTESMIRTPSHGAARRDTLERRLSELTILRRRAMEAAAAPHVVVLPPNASPKPSPTPEASPDEEPQQPQPLLSSIPLPVGVSVDAAQCAVIALRAAARLAPILLLPSSNRIDTRGAARMLGKIGARALAVWIEAWGRRPVIQVFRASADRRYDGLLIQHLLADQLAVALASDSLLAHDAELLNQTFGAKPAPNP